MGGSSLAGVAICAVGIMWMNSPLLFSLLTRDLAAAGQGAVLLKPIGLGDVLLLDVLRWVFMCAALSAVAWAVESGAREYAEATELSIHARRSAKRGKEATRNSRTPMEEQYAASSSSTSGPSVMLMDILLVKLLVIFFPSVQLHHGGGDDAVSQERPRVRAGSKPLDVATGSSTLPQTSKHGVHVSASIGAEQEEVETAEAASASPGEPRSSPERPWLARSLSEGRGLHLLSFHEDIVETNRTVPQILVRLSTCVMIITLSSLLTLPLEAKYVVQLREFLHVSAILRILAPVASAARVVVADLLNHSGGDGVLGSAWDVVATCIQIGLWVFTCIAVLGALGFDMTSYVAGLGISSIAAAFAAQRTLSEVFATASLLADGTFHVGDRLVFDGVEGTVQSIGMRSTCFVTTYSGETMIVPNSKLAQGVLLNRSEMLSRRVKCSFIVAADTPHGRLESIQGLVEGAVGLAPHATFVYAHLMSLSLDGFVFEYVFTVLGNTSKDYKAAQHAINLGLVAALHAKNIKLAKRPVSK